MTSPLILPEGKLKWIYDSPCRSTMVT